MKLLIEEKKNLEHALKHLKANKIHEDENGWYTGNKCSFIRRHVRAIGMLEMWLEMKK